MNNQNECINIFIFINSVLVLAVKTKQNKTNINSKTFLRLLFVDHFV